MICKLKMRVSGLKKRKGRERRKRDGKESRGNNKEESKRNEKDKIESDLRRRHKTENVRGSPKKRNESRGWNESRGKEKSVNG